MKDKINAYSLATVAALLLESWALLVVGASPQRWRPSMVVRDEPGARVLYETMIRTLREARSLSYTSTCSALDDSSSTYCIWLRKPRSFHVEQTNGTSLKSTTFLDDGEHFWIHWDGDRPTLLLDTEKSREEPRSDVYVKEASLAGTGSIRDRIALLGTAWLGLVLDPSIFHGYPDPLEPFIDGIRSRGTNRVADEECDVIEVSFLKARCIRYIWLSREDHLPRKIKEIVRGAETHVTIEEWSNVTVDGAIPPKVLSWSPPPGWRQWDLPKLEDSLLKKEQVVPDFEFRSARRGRIRLSDYRGQVVWLYAWHAGSPACRTAMPGFQRLHQDYRDQGLTILGFNCMDDRRIARAFLRAHGLTLPSVLDSSDGAARMLRRSLGDRLGIVPLNYIIDPQGHVVDGWFGNEQDPERVLAALQAAGLKLAQ